VAVRGDDYGGAAVKSALRELLADLTTVRADVRSGGEPPATAVALHASASTANAAGESCWPPIEVVTLSDRDMRRYDTANRQG